MLSLKKNSEFQKVFKNGKWYGAEYISLYVEKNKNDFNKIGIAVGKKVAKSVKRNRMRRLIREAYRKNENQIITGYNIVIVLKNDVNVETLTFETVQKDLVKALRKAEII